MKLGHGVRWTAALLLAGSGLLGAKLISRRDAAITIPAGTQIVGTLDQTVSTGHSRVGDAVSITSTEPIKAESATIQSGVRVRGELTTVKSGGRLGGEPRLSIRFNQLEVDGQRYSIATESFRVEGKSAKGETAKEIGGGAVVGGVIGAIAGNTVKGVVIGAVLGTGVAVATKGHEVELPAGQRLRVTLRESVAVR